jgi:hypothetical protein
VNTIIACAVCFGAADSPQFRAMQIGILVLLGVTGGMLAAFATFFLYLRRRIRAFDEQTPVAAGRAPGGSY